MIFADRREAGRSLASALASEPFVRDAARVVVLAIPRGGIPVGAEVARALGAPLDVAIARELRAPHDPDIPFGVVGADDYVEVDEDTVERLGLSEAEVAAEVDRRTAAVKRRLALYREALEEPSLEDAVAIVVDDGVASGGTARRACELAWREGAAHVVLAAPLAALDAEEALADVTDRVVVLTYPDEFLSVGQAYLDFPRLSDEELLELLRAIVR